MKIEIKKVKNLSRAEKVFINQTRAEEFGSDEKKDFNKYYEPDTLFFFVKDNGETVAFGGLRPIKIIYLGVKYNILGICSTISIKKGKGYGRAFVEAMIDYFKKTGKSALGFTGKTKFFKKVGLGTKKDFIKRFVYRNPKTGEEVIDNDGDGIYYDGKDNFIKKVLSTKGVVYINVLHW